jgi:hypothetical protein
MEEAAMAGLSQEEFETASREIRGAWDAAETRDQGFNVIVDFGRKYGYKNVIAAIQGRTPKQFERETSVSDWVEKQRQEEATS